MRFKLAIDTAVSVYLHWGVTEGKQGTLDFTNYRSHTDFYQVAKEVGIFVIVRPGVSDILACPLVY
jgi:beta-galactosidase GanA